MSLTFWKLIRAFAVALLAIGGFSFVFDGEFPFSLSVMLIGLVATIVSQYMIKNLERNKHHNSI